MFGLRTLLPTERSSIIMQSKHTVDKAFFPRWTRKSITFTIDDGNLKLDRKFISIIRQAGFLGAFNLVSNYIKDENRAEYKELYRGYEIANHCKYHPYALTDIGGLTVSEEPYDPKTASPEFIYKTDIEGLYHEGSPKAYRLGAVAEVYLRLAEEGRRELRELCGEDKIHGFVWHYGMQSSPEIFESLKKQGYLYIRKTGDLLDTTGFALPKDRMMWSYNAHNQNLLEVAEKYGKYPDDGELKMLAFGVHSHDFENADNWDVLREFAQIYGNRHNDFWYATPSDIFLYEDAVNALQVTDSEIINTSPITLYVTVDGMRVILQGKSTHKF